MHLQAPPFSVPPAVHNLRPTVHSLLVSLPSLSLPGKSQPAWLHGLLPPLSWRAIPPCYCQYCSCSRICNGARSPPSLGIQLYTTQAKMKDLVAYVKFTSLILSYSATYTILLSHRPLTWQHRQRCIGAVLLIQPSHRACCRAPAPIKISPARYTTLPLEPNVI